MREGRFNVELLMKRERKRKKERERERHRETVREYERYSQRGIERERETDRYFAQKFKIYSFVSFVLNSVQYKGQTKVRTFLRIYWVNQNLLQYYVFRGIKNAAVLLLY